MRVALTIERERNKTWRAWKNWYSIGRLENGGALPSKLRHPIRFRKFAKWNKMTYATPGVQVYENSLVNPYGQPITKVVVDPVLKSNEPRIPVRANRGTVQRTQPVPPTDPASLQRGRTHPELRNHGLIDSALFL